MLFFKNFFYGSLSLFVVAMIYLFASGGVGLFSLIVIFVLFAVTVYFALGYGRFCLSLFRIEDGATYRLVGHTDNILMLKKTFDGDVFFSSGSSDVSGVVGFVSPSSETIKVPIHSVSVCTFYGRILSSKKHELKIGDLCVGVRGFNVENDGVVKKVN
jgi:hypothetical protein